MILYTMAVFLIMCCDNIFISLGSKWSGYEMIHFDLRFIYTCFPSISFKIIEHITYLFIYYTKMFLLSIAVINLEKKVDSSRNNYLLQLQIQAASPMTRQWNFVLLGFCDALKSLAVMVPSEAALAAPMILPLVAVAGLPQRSFLLDIFLWLQVRSSTHGLEVNSQFRKKTTKILLKRVSLISSTTLRYKNHHIFACFLKKVLISIFLGL